MNPLLLGGIIGLLVSAACYLYIGKSDRQRSDSVADYFFYRWSLQERLVSVTMFSSSMSLATVVIALIQLAAVFGIALSWATITYCAGWTLFLIASRAIRARTGPRDTIHSFLGNCYGSKTIRIVAAMATIVGFMGLFATELFAADAVLRALGVSPALVTLLLIVFGLVTISYASLGGFRSVVRSDWIQTTLLVVAIAVIVGLTARLWVLGGSPNLASIPQAQQFTLPTAVALSLFFINVPYPFVDTQAWQRARAAATDKDVTRGTIKAVVGFAVIWSILIAAGIVLAGSLTNGRDPFQALFVSIQTLGPLSAFLVGMLLVPGLLAAMFSSADGFINAAAHVYSLDLTNAGAGSDDAQVTTLARLHVVLVGSIALILCLGLRTVGFGIVDMVFSISAGQVALFPSVVIALIRREAIQRLRLAAIISISSGFIVAWLNGIYATLSVKLTLPYADTIARFAPPDVYRSPIYAFGVSCIVFLLFAVITGLRFTGKGTASEVR